jgi:flagella basal body P-ring formation protein FlgA
MPRALRALALLVALGAAPLGATEIEPPERILQAAEDFLQQRAEGLGSGRVEVEAGPLDPRLRLRACAHLPDAFTPAGGRELGRTTVGVRCEAPKRWTLYVPARISVYGPALVAARALGRGERLSEADLRREERDLARLPTGSLDSLTEAEGMLMKRSVSAGTPITRSMLKREHLVQRGQEVTLIAEGTGVQVRSVGKAMDDAAKGERVRVKNTSSGRIVEGRAVAAGVVRIAF